MKTRRTGSERGARRRSAAEGEGRAARSLAYQYEMAATRIYDALRDRTLGRVWLGDEEAGRADDVVIEIDGAVDAYSAKYDDGAAPLTFADLVRRDSDRGRCLIGDLYDGYDAIERRHPGKRFTIVLVSNRPASTHDRGGGISMARLDRELFCPLAENADATLPVDTAAAFTTIATVLGADESNVRRFLHHLRFEFGEESALRTAEQARKEDVEQLYQELWRRRSEPRARSVVLTRDEILRSLRWQDRPEFANVHFFPIAPDRYEPLPGAVEQLEALIAQHKGGYVAVLGGPGSGKSTLIEDVLTRLGTSFADLDLIPYFAYVRDDMPVLAREDAMNFLHDVCLRARQYGIVRPDHLISNSVAELRREFHDVIRAAGERYARSGRRTLIVVDGLDHVWRGLSRITFPLTDELPPAAKIPNGVLFVLGSQYVDDLRPDIKARITPERRLDISSLALTAPQVRAIVQRVVPDASDRTCELVLHLCAGYPLALTFALQALEQAPPDDAVATLEALPAYAGSTTEYFGRLMGRALNDAKLRDVFGILSRIRRPLLLDWLLDLPNSAFYDLASYHHLFRRDDSIWTFAHDSLKHYIATTTCQVGGVPNETLDRRLHALCADRCASSRIELYRWEELYHRARAGDDAAVARLATQAAFREQFCAFRNNEHIRGDIALAIQGACRTRDPVGIWRLALALSELAARESSAGPGVTWELLVELGDPIKALLASGARETRQIPARRRLALARAFMDQRQPEIARMLHRGIDPIDVLPLGRDGEPLATWADLALRLDGADALRASEPRLMAAFTRFANERTHGKAPAEAWVRCALALGALKSGELAFPLEKLAQLESVPFARGLFAELALLLAETAKAGPQDEIVDRLTGLPELDDAHPETMLKIASFLMRCGCERDASAMLDRADAIKREPSSPFEGVRYDLAREQLLVRLGRELPPIIEVPDPMDVEQHYETDQFVELSFAHNRYVRADMLRKLAVLATSPPASGTALVTAAEESLHPWVVANADDPVYGPQELFAAYIDELTTAASRLPGGAATLYSLWFTGGMTNDWPFQFKRRALTGLGRAGLATVDAHATAESLDLAVNEITSTVTQAAQESIRMWIALGQRDRALQSMTSLIRRSFDRCTMLHSFLPRLRALAAVDAVAARDAVEWMIAGAEAERLTEWYNERFISGAVQVLAEIDLERAVYVAGTRRYWLNAIAPLCRALVVRGEPRIAATYLTELLVPLVRCTPITLMLAAEVMTALARDPEFVERFATQVRAVAPHEAQREWLGAAAWGLLQGHTAIPDSIADVDGLVPVGEAPYHGGAVFESFFPSPSPPPSSLGALVARRDALPLRQQRRLLELLPAEDGESLLLQELIADCKDDRYFVGTVGLRAFAHGDRKHAEEIWSSMQCDVHENRSSPHDAGWLSYFRLGIALGHVRPYDVVESFSASVIDSQEPDLEMLGQIEQFMGSVPDPRRVWAECSNYLSALWSGVEEPAPNRELERRPLLPWVVGDRIDCPAFTIRDAVRRTATRAVVERHPDAPGWLRASARAGRSDGALVAACAFSADATVCQELRDELAPCYLAGDGRARQAADELGWSPRDVPPKRSDYRVEMIPDALERVHAELGEAATRGILAVAHRLSQPREEIASLALRILAEAPPPTLDELSISFWIDSTRLTRTRFMLREVVRRAYAPGGLGVHASLRFFDPALQVIPIAQRPSCVGKPVMPAGDGNADPATLLAGLVRLPSDSRTIAERSSWTSIGSDQRRRLIRIARGLAFKEGGELGNDAYKASIETELDYWALGTHPLVFNIPADIDEWVMAQWIALRPRAAAILGWKRVGKGLPRYVDLHGRVVAETILWRDGAFGLNPHRADLLNGIGSAILMREDSFTMLLRAFDEVHVVDRVIVNGDELKSADRRERHWAPPLAPKPARRRAQSRPRE